MPTRLVQLLVAVCLLAFMDSASAQQRFTTPLPADARVVPPAPNVPPEMAAFSGQWAGQSEHGYSAGLVVEQVTPLSASVIYSWAGVPSAEPAGWMRVYGQFVSGKLRIELSRRTVVAVVTYTMRNDGRLDMDYENPRGSETAVLTKVVY
jgi:hypothetical protein